MANVLLNQGTQTAIATDVVGTINYQIIKLDFGAAGTSTLFGTANPLPVTMSSGISRILDSIDTIWYGTPSSTSGTVLNTNTQILAPNANRKGFIFTNLGTTPIYVCYGTTATVINGEFLGTTGNIRNPSNYVPVGTISGITAGGSSIIAIQELI